MGTGGAGEAPKGCAMPVNEPEQRNSPPAAEYFQPVAFPAGSLADENRLRILVCVSGGKRSAGSIVEELNLSQPPVSHHPRELKRSSPVEIERSGPFVCYEPSDPKIPGIIQSLKALAGDLSPAGKVFQYRAGAEKVSMAGKRPQDEQ